jgi:PAS domain S-box-containing protein
MKEREDNIEPEETLKALRESAEKYRLLVQNANVGILVLQDGLVRFANPRALSFSGYSEEEVTSRPFLERVHPDDREGMAERFRQRIAGKRDPAVYPFRFVDKQGQYRWVEVNSVPIAWQGKPAVLSFLADIEERKRAEEALRESVAMSRAVLDHSPVGISIRDQAGALLQVNEAWKKIWAMSDADIREAEKESKGLSWKERCPYLGESARDVERLFHPEGGISILYFPEMEVKAPRPGAAQWVSQYLYALRSQEGRTEKIVILTQDITERMEAEEALRESEEKYRLVVQQASDAILVAQEGRMKFVNPRVQEVTGYTEEELTSRPFLEFIHPEDRRMVGERHQNRLQGKAVPPAYPFRIVTKSGEDRWVEIRAVIIPWQGKPATLNFLTDITERRKTEEALKKSEAQYRELVENANSIILRRDPEGRITFFNEFAQRFFGYQENEILGRNVVGTIVPEKETSGRDLAEMIRDISRHPERYATNENENVLRSGERVWVTWTNKPIFGPDGKLAEILCIGNDVTTRKRAEDALEASEAKYRTLVEGMSEAVMQVDNEDRIQFVNPQFCQMMGYREDELLGRVGYEIYFDPEAQELIRRKNLLRKEKISDAYEIRMRKKAGEEVQVRISGAPVTDTLGNVVGSIGVITDITERKSLEEHVRQLQKMEAIGRLSGGVAHDFNNLLQGIMGFAEMALRKLPADDPLRRYLEGIEKTVEKAASLTYQLLAFSRKQVFQPVVVEFNEIVRESEKMLRRLIGEDIEIVTRLDPEAGRVKVDPIQVEQVVMNLAVNARDAMPKGGRLILETSAVELDPEFIRSSHPDLAPGPHVVLKVSDTGCGMDSETLTHIFEPFFTTKEKGKGTGLGLATVYGIVRQSGGGIEVQSTLGKGTVFQIYFPREEQEVSAREKVATLSEIPKGTETVLLVEDEDELRGMMRENLTQYGYAVLEAENGEAALQLFREHPGKVDLLISDVVMPKMSGPDLARQLGPLLPELKVIFISGYPDDATLSHGLQPLGLAFLQKPFKPHILLRKVREILDNPKTE